MLKAILAVAAAILVVTDESQARAAADTFEPGSGAVQTNDFLGVTFQGWTDQSGLVVARASPTQWLEPIIQDGAFEVGAEEMAISLLPNGAAFAEFVLDAFDVATQNALTVISLLGPGTWGPLWPT